VIFTGEHRGLLQYRRDHCVATVDFSKMSPVCGSRSAAAAASAQLNSHSSRMSAVVEGARENVSLGFEYPWKGKRLLLFSGVFLLLLTVTNLLLLYLICLSINPVCTLQSHQR